MAEAQKAFYKLVAILERGASSIGPPSMGRGGPRTQAHDMELNVLTFPHVRAPGEGDFMLSNMVTELHFHSRAGGLRLRSGG